MRVSTQQTVEMVALASDAAALDLPVPFTSRARAPSSKQGERARMEDLMNRQHRLQLIAMAQRVTEVSRLCAEYEREVLREREGAARGTEAPPAPRPRVRRHC
jgi:hypothetical protein